MRIEQVGRYIITLIKSDGTSRHYLCKHKIHCVKQGIRSARCEFLLHPAKIVKFSKFVRIKDLGLETIATPTRAITASAFGYIRADGHVLAVREYELLDKIVRLPKSDEYFLLNVDVLTKLYTIRDCTIPQIDARGQILVHIGHKELTPHDSIGTFDFDGEKINLQATAPITFITMLTCSITGKYTFWQDNIAIPAVVVARAVIDM